MTHATYPGAPASLVERWEQRREPMGFGPGEGLPGLDANLAAIAQAIVPETLPPLPRGAGRHARKEREIAPEFAGQSALYLLHALTVAHLRKRHFPAHAPALFRRLWAEMRTPLLAGLPTRWLISAAITFADHGLTEGERRLGAELNVLFSLIKLYEFERLFSGRAPDAAFRMGRRSRAALPLGMPEFALGSGGLDINLLAPIWQRAEREPVLGPIAVALFERMNADPGTIFARLAAMRARKAARAAQT
jgi:hypothetical protein